MNMKMTNPPRNLPSRGNITGRLTFVFALLAIFRISAVLIHVIATTRISTIIEAPRDTKDTILGEAQSGMNDMMKDLHTSSSNLFFIE